MKEERIIKGLLFKLTCPFCPEQYDVFRVEDYDTSKEYETLVYNKAVAYVRLRWGYLTVEVPTVGGKRIYTHFFEDSYKGCFDDKKEREKFLNIIADKILEDLERKRKE